MDKEILMTRTDAARIQAAACKNNNGITPQHSFAARAMSTAYKNEPYKNTSDKAGCCPVQCVLQ